MLTRASPVGFGVVLVALCLSPCILLTSPAAAASGQEVDASEERREGEEDFEWLRRQQIEALQESVWYITRLLWCILLCFVALVLGLLLKSTEVRRARPFDPKRDRKKPVVFDENKLES